MPQVNILMSNFHSVVFFQHMGFKKQLKENSTHLLIPEAFDFIRVCQNSCYIYSISELKHTEDCDLSFEIVVRWPKKNRCPLLYLHGMPLTDGYNGKKKKSFAAVKTFRSFSSPYNNRAY